MKLCVVLGLVMLLVSSPVGMSTAKMYWDGSAETDATISAKDVQAKTPARAPTTSLPKMYDDYKVLDIDGEHETQQNVPPVVTPMPRRSAVTSGLPSRRRSTTPPAFERSRRPGVTRAEPAQSIADKPRPVASAPGKGPRPEAGSIGEDLKTQTSGPAETTSPPPPTKKMPWGQVDVKSAEPEKKNLKWGEK